MKNNLYYRERETKPIWLKKSLNGAETIYTLEKERAELQDKLRRRNAQIRQLKDELSATRMEFIQVQEENITLNEQIGN